MENIKKYAVLTCLALAAPLLDGQVVAGSSFFDEVISDWHMGWTFDASGGAAVPACTDNNASDRLGVYDASAVLKFQGVREKDALDVSIGYTHLYYDWGGTSLFSDMQKVKADLFYSRNLVGRWSVFAIYAGTLGAESGGDLFDGGRMLAAGGAAYKFSETLRAGIGAGALSRLDNDWIPLPVGYVDWRITERLSLRTFSGGALIYDFYGDGLLLINLACEYCNTDYRLTRSAAGVDRSVRDSYVQATFGVSYNFSKSGYISASAGGNFSRKLVFRTPSGSGEEMEVDSAPVFYLHAGVKF